MSNRRFTYMRQPLELFAGQMFTRAAEYLGAFERLTEGGKVLQPYASYFLLSHALELQLKAYLAARGVSRRKLEKKLGHRLLDIKRECEVRGIPKVLNLDRLVIRMHDINEDHDLRYPSGYRLSFPPPEEALSIAFALRNAIAPAVETAHSKAKVAFAAKTRHLRGKKVRWFSPE